MMYKKQILCLSLLLLLTSVRTTSAQNRSIAPIPFSSDLATHYYISGNALGQTSLLHTLPPIYIPIDRIPYYKVLSEVLLESKAKPLALEKFLEQFPTSTDRNRAMCSIGKIDLASGHFPEALFYLSQVETEGFSKSEEIEYRILLSLVRLRQSEPKINEQLLQNERLSLEEVLPKAEELTPAIDSYILGQGRLHLALLYWQEGKHQTTDALLSLQDWDKTIEEEVAYYRALHAYETQSPAQAIELSRATIQRYPTLKGRIPLRGAMAQAYFRLGNFALAVSELPPVGIDQFSPADNYAIGSSFFSLGQVRQSIPYLSEVCRAQSVVGAMAQLALGTARIRLGKTAEAILAYTEASNHPKATPLIKEHALLNSIMAYASSGAEMFGQNIRLAERFLTSYPNSKDKDLVSEQLKYFYSNSKDYLGALSSIERLAHEGVHFAPIQQYLLLRLAEIQQQRGEQNNFQTTIQKAIQLGAISPYYTEALTLSASRALEQEEWKTAESYAQKALEADKSIRTNINQYILGYALYNQRRYSEALTALKAFTEKTKDLNLRTDALCRIGDCLLVQNNKSSEAITYYTEADRLQPEGSDEAKIRLIELYRLRGQYKEQIEQIEALLRQHPQSPFLPEALYHKAKAVMQQKGSLAEIDAIYTEIADKFPQSSFASKAALERALLYYNSGEETKALELYKEVIKNYPDREEAKTALSDLKTIYLDKGQPDSYTTYVESLGKNFALGAAETAQLKYLSLETKARKQELTEQELKDYLLQYPSAPERTQVEQLLANLYLSSGRKAEALALYKKLVSSNMLSPSERTQTEVRMAQLLLDQKDLVGAEQLTQRLLTQAKLSDDQRKNLTLLQGKAIEAQGRVDEALKVYKSLLPETDTSYGAEAYIRSAQLHYNSKRIKEAKAMLEELLQRGSSEQYWLARGVLLLSDCAFHLNEPYLAEQYLESLQTNYQGTESDIKEGISLRLRKYKR